MPIYAYQCQACGHELEAIQRVNDAPLELCPACNKRKLSKQLTAGRFRLSGSGWYETDFKTGNKKNLAGDKSGDTSGGDKAPAASAPAAAATPKADSAPAAKASTP